MCFLLPGPAVPGSRRSRSDGRRHVGSAHRTKSKASFEAEFHTLRLPLTAPRPRPPACRRRTHSPGVQLRAPGTPDFPGGAGGIPPCVSGGWGWGRGRGGQALSRGCCQLQAPGPAAAGCYPGRVRGTGPGRRPLTLRPSPWRPGPGRAPGERPRLGDRAPSDPAGIPPTAQPSPHVCLKVARSSDRPPLSRTIVAFRV